MLPQGLLHLIPSDRLMIETDSPYLVPRTIKPNKARPHRNEPCLLGHVLKQVAAALGKSEAEVRKSVLLLPAAALGSPDWLLGWRAGGSEHHTGRKSSFQAAMSLSRPSQAGCRGCSIPIMARKARIWKLPNDAFVAGLSAVPCGHIWPCRVAREKPAREEARLERSWSSRVL